MVASLFALRARMLQKALRRMLEDDIRTWRSTNLTFLNYLVSLGNDLLFFFKPFLYKNTLFDRFYAHPTIKYLAEGKANRKPSYLHASSFSATLIQLLRGEEYNGRTDSESAAIKKALDGNYLQINTETRKHLIMLFGDAQEDSNIFRLRLEEWYEETMQRTTGWYKKQTQFLLLAIGFFLAWQFNVDSIAITRILIKDKHAREQTVHMALQRMDEYTRINDTLTTYAVQRSVLHLQDTGVAGIRDTVVYDTVYTLTPRDRILDSLKQELQADAFHIQGLLGLGDVAAPAKAACTQQVNELDSLLRLEPDDKELKRKRDAAFNECLKAHEKHPFQQSNSLKIIGWLLTALAISLGSSFWFDLLNRVVRLRQTGSRPQPVTEIFKGRETPEKPISKTIRG